MMVKIIPLLLGVAALATAEVADHLNHDLSSADEVNRISQEVSAAMSPALSPMLNRYKSRLTCQLNAIDKFKKTVADCIKGGKVAFCLCIRYNIILYYVMMMMTVVSSQGSAYQCIRMHIQFVHFQGHMNLGIILAKQKSVSL